MDIDHTDGRPPSPPAPAFVKRSKQGARSVGISAGTSTATNGGTTSTTAQAGQGQVIDGEGGGGGGGAEEDEDGPSVVVRSRGFGSASQRNRIQGTRSSMTSQPSRGSTAGPSTRTPNETTSGASSLQGALSSTLRADDFASRPSPALASSRLGASDTFAVDKDIDAAEDFIPIRTRRAPVASLQAELETLTGNTAEDLAYVEEDIIIPVYENQEVLPDPGPIDNLDFLQAGANGIADGASHSKHQPSRLDEPQEQSASKKERKSTTMKDEGVIPSITSASTSLQALLQQAEADITAYETVVADANKNLALLVEEETENKKIVSDAGDKEAWFRELEHFIGTVAAFLDAKMPMLEAVERDYISLAAQRSRLIQQARAKDMEDELALFYGVPAVSVLPPSRDPVSSGDTEEGSSTFLAPIHDAPPLEDGPALSPIRETRRLKAAQRLAQGEDADELSPADRIGFQDARAEVYAQLQRITADVHAAEFLDPAATVPDDQEGQAEGLMMSNGTSRPTTRRPHPASLVSRFGAWRTRYPDEYSGTWGGLALAGAWEFWCRRELADVDLLRPAAKYRAAEGEPGAGLELRRFGWYARLSEYVGGSNAGGDEEAMEAVLGNVVVPRLVALAEGGAFDPWSSQDAEGILHLATQIRAGVDPNGWRFESLLKAYLDVFRTHIGVFLRASVELAPVAPPAALHPGIPAARLSLLRRLLGLYLNLVGWYPLVNDAHRPALAGLANDLAGRGVWPQLVAAKDFGASEVARELLRATPEGMLASELVSNVISLAATTTAS